MKGYLRLMRVHHYLKNLLVFAALVCSGQLFADGEKFAAVCISFAAFCLVSSVVYIINDIRDAEKDRRHPTKCQRPIAAGTVSVTAAYRLAAVLLIAAAACCAAVFSWGAAALLAGYLVMNLAYSMGLKNIPIVDISILVAGFLIRVLYGALAAEIQVSNWLYLTVTAMAFYFALGKRRNELKRLTDGQTRQVLRAYPASFLDKSMVMCLTLANMFYALWCMDENTTALYKSSYLVLTVPIVMVITMKYSMTVEGDSDGDPVEVLLHDKVLMVLCAIYLVSMAAILYL